MTGRKSLKYVYAAQHAATALVAIAAEFLVYAAKDVRENTVHTPWLTVPNKVQVT